MENFIFCAVNTPRRVVSQVGKTGKDINNNGVLSHFNNDKKLGVLLSLRTDKGLYPNSGCNIKRG